MEVSRERKRERDPTREQRLGPAGLDPGLKLRASARSRFGGFRVWGGSPARRVSSTTHSTPFPGRYQQRARCAAAARPRRYFKLYERRGQPELKVGNYIEQSLATASA